MVRSALFRARSNKESSPNREQNCFGRSSPLTIRVRFLSRVPSPPARRTPQRLPCRAFRDSCWFTSAIQTLENRDELSAINRPTRWQTSVLRRKAIFFSSWHFSGGEGSVFGPRSWQGQPGEEPPWSRFCLSHFRRRRTTSKLIGPRRVEDRSFANARFA